mgnify:CR=1 FL=1
MNSARRAALYRLAASAYEMKIDVMTGTLSQDENGRWRVGNQSLAQWLSEHDGQEVTLVLGNLEDDTPVQVRTCRTCGRDYTDLECPTCRSNRIRLRGRA